MLKFFPPLPVWTMITDLSAPLWLLVNNDDGSPYPPFVTDVSNDDAHSVCDGENDIPLTTIKNTFFID